MRSTTCPVLITLLATALMAGCSGVPSGLVEPNLVAQSIQIEPASPVESTPFNVTVGFTNSGSNISTANFDIRLRILDSSNGRVYEEIKRYTSDVDEDELVRVSFRPAVTLSSGTYFAESFIDVSGEVDESDEDDNDRRYEFIVAPADDG